jgi:glucosyl-dolichyl phosphate glucuronosyltransferase
MDTVHLSKITVILCTYNRCESLVKALNSVAASRLPAGVEWEVLVVDNNSSDGTRGVVQGFCQRLPARFRYLFESRQGKSYALNAGIREARGDILAFMDDDVVVDPDWVGNLTACLHGAEWAGAGGRILPENAFSPPRWLSLQGPYGMGGVLALFDRGSQPGELDWAPFGTNMAFRRAMFEKYGGFRTDLGPQPGGVALSEDTEFGRRLQALGERLRYEPCAIVYHVLPASRLRTEYFLKWWFDFGRSVVRENGEHSDPRQPVIPQVIVGTIPVMLRWLLAVNPQRRFYCKTRVWLAAGKIFEAYRQGGFGHTKRAAASSE